jgi:hypothetical protein
VAVPNTYDTRLVELTQGAIELRVTHLFVIGMSCADGDQIVRAHSVFSEISVSPLGLDTVVARCVQAVNRTTGTVVVVLKPGLCEWTMAEQTYNSLKSFKDHWAEDVYSSTVDVCVVQPAVGPYMVKCATFYS